jgi:hypothetical protein
MTQAFEIGVPRRLIEKFLRKMLPIVAEVMQLFKDKADADGLTPKLKKYIELYQIGSWADAYEDPASIISAPLSALFCLDNSPEQVLTPPKFESIDDIYRWLDSIWKECERYIDVDCDDIAFMDEGHPLEPWKLLPEDEDGKPITRQAVFLSAAIILVFNYFSCMVHRKSLFQLVALAKKGNDGALVKAVQIDKTCLTDIPYFRERMEELTRQGKVPQLQKIAQAMQKPIFQSGTVLNSLYLAFSLLDAMGTLDAFAKDRERFADFCQSLGIYGPEGDAVDVESFEKTYYRFKNQYQSLSPHKNNSKIIMVVKDTN